MLIFLTVIFHIVTITHSIIPFPSPSQYSFPPPPVQPGTIHHVIHDNRTSTIYTSLLTNTSAYILALSAESFWPLWLLPLPSLPETAPTIVLSSDDTLFAITPIQPSFPSPSFSPSPSLTLSPSPSSSTLVDLILYRINAKTGDIVSHAHVDSVRLANAPIRCILKSASITATAVFIVYLVQDGLNPSIATTRLVRMNSHIDGPIQQQWSIALTPPPISASSAAIAISDSSLVVVESTLSFGSTSHGVSMYKLSWQGDVRDVATMPATNEDSVVAAVGMDDAEGIYVAEKKGSLYQVGTQNIDGKPLMTKIWNVSDVDVVDMYVLQNGSGVVALENGKGFRNTGSTLVRTTTPVISLYNSSGSTVMKETYVEPVPEVHREMFAMSMVQEKFVIMGGFYELNKEAERQISLGLFSLPNYFTKEKQTGNQSQTATPQSPDTPIVEKGNSNTTVVLVGAFVGVAVLFVVLGVGLFVLYRSRGDGDEQEKRTEEEAAHPDRNQSVRGNNVLV